MSVLDRVTGLNAKVGTVADHLRSPLLLVMRLYWGWQFFMTGKGKLMNLDKTTDFFASLSIPAPRVNAAMAGSIECFGGLLLLVGFCSRIITIPLATTMVVAYLTAHREFVVGMFENPDGFVTQPPFLFLLTAVIVLAFGPGAFSVDALLARRGARASGNKSQVS